MTKVQPYKTQSSIPWKFFYCRLMYKGETSWRQRHKMWGRKITLWLHWKILIQRLNFTFPKVELRGIHVFRVWRRSIKAMQEIRGNWITGLWRGIKSVSSSPEYWGYCRILEWYLRSSSECGRKVGRNCLFLLFVFWKLLCMTGVHVCPCDCYIFIWSIV